VLPAPARLLGYSRGPAKLVVEFMGGAYSYVFDAFCESDRQEVEMRDNGTIVLWGVGWVTKLVTRFDNGLTCVATLTPTHGKWEIYR
jgi:hypothetical protein